MRKLFTFFILVLTGLGAGYSATPDKAIEPPQDDKQVEVFYFHLTRRCATCKAVENVTRNYVEKRYGDSVSFKALNLDEKEGRSVADKHHVSGQALIIVGGETTTDITGKAFMNALNNPEKLEELISEIIDPLLIRTR
ncbi:MAG: nitrophenyl compound nitroreductase subunit ArsF family protein [Bacteroidales bacterium]